MLRFQLPVGMAGKQQGLRVFVQNRTQLLVLRNSVPFLFFKRAGDSIHQRLMQEEKDWLICCSRFAVRPLAKLQLQPLELFSRQAAEYR
ncbi:hypothetical protein D3C75_436850 [compost metagenome]